MPLAIRQQVHHAAEKLDAAVSIYAPLEDFRFTARAINFDANGWWIIIGLGTHNLRMVVAVYSLRRTATSWVN